MNVTHPRPQATACLADLRRSALKVRGPESRLDFYRQFGVYLREGQMDADLGLFLVCLAMGAVEFRTRRLRLPTEHTVLYVGAVAFQDDCRAKAPEGAVLPDVWPRALRGRQLCDDAARCSA